MFTIEIADIICDTQGWPKPDTGMRQRWWASSVRRHVN
jgi:hypothetical protein